MFGVVSLEVENYGFKPMKSPYREHSRSWRVSRDGAPYEDSAPGLT